MVTRRRAYYSGLFLACVAARLATTIYYVEDTDSLRFALSVEDEFDLARLQPHFPGYPVFWAAAKGLYLITGSFAVSFSLIGGMATFAVIYAALKLSRRDPLSADGLAIAFVLFFNPMVWLMGNRYMPDLMGLAVALSALHLLSSHRFDAGLHPSAAGSHRFLAGSHRFAAGSDRFAAGSDRFLAGLPRPAAGSHCSDAGGVLTGLLAGTRLSYLPLLLPAYMIVLRRRPLRLLAYTVAGLVPWLVPLIIDAGWGGLIGAATRQTEGHFTDFGGGVATDPGVITRLVRLLESMWADGFGAWLPGRHWLTLIVGIALIGVLAVVVTAAVRAKYARANSPHANSGRANSTGTDPGPADTTDVNSFRADSTRANAAPLDSASANSLHADSVRANFLHADSARAALLVAAACVYALWIFLFQNVIYKSRHVLPLVALLAIPVGVGFGRGVRSRSTFVRGFAVAGALAYAAVTIVLVAQHREPTAIAQAKTFVEEVRPDVVASIPLVNYYLSAQGVDAAFLSVQNDEDRNRLRQARGKLLIVGRFPELMPPNPAQADTFYHNPYVNRMWPDVEVYVYDR